MASAKALANRNRLPSMQSLGRRSVTLRYEKFTMHTSQFAIFVGIGLLHQPVDDVLCWHEALS